mgnify:CR=1 FL=1|jgi:hypothetical protein
MKKQRVHMPKKEFYALKEGYEITEQLVFEVARYKLYYMLSNAYNRTKTREEYKDVEYRLGEFRDGIDNLKKHRSELYDKYLKMIRTYLEKEMDGDYAPTIHRTKQHYEWKTIDILTAKEHKEIDNSKTTIIRNQVMIGKSKGKGKSKPLTMKIIRQMAEGKQFPSITKAIEYIEKEYGISENKIKKFIDTGEIIETEKGSFEVLRAESKDKVTQLKMEQFRNWFMENFPESKEIMKQFVEIVSTPEGLKRFKLALKLSEIKRKGYKLKKDGYKGLKIRWSV